MATRAKRLGLPVVALAGTIGQGADINYSHGIDSMASILTAPCSLNEAISQARELLIRAAESTARTIGIGLQLQQTLQVLRPRLLLKTV